MGVRVDGAAGPLALGAKGSVRDQLTPPGRVEGFRPRKLYSTAPLEKYGALSGAIFYAAFGGENHTTALAGEEMHSPFGALRHHLPPAERWDYGCLAMESCLCRKA